MGKLLGFSHSTSRASEEEEVDGWEAIFLFTPASFVAADPVDTVSACWVKPDTPWMPVLSSQVQRGGAVSSCRRCERGKGRHLSFLCLETQHPHNQGWCNTSFKRLARFSVKKYEHARWRSHSAWFKPHWSSKIATFLTSWQSVNLISRYLVNNAQEEELWNIVAARPKAAAEASVCHCDYCKSLTASCASPSVLDLLNAFKMICLKISCYKPEHFPESERGTLLAVTCTSLFWTLPDVACSYTAFFIQPFSNSQEEEKIKWSSRASLFYSAADGAYFWYFCHK